MAVVKVHMLQSVQQPTMAIQIMLPIRYANILLRWQDETGILSASQHMNHYLPAGISY